MFSSALCVSLSIQFFVVLLVIYKCNFVINYEVQQNRETYDVNGYCENGEPCFDEQLTRLPGVEVGHVEKIFLGDGQPGLDMKTVSVKPLILEVPNFLSDSECSHFINIAKERGLQDSSTYKGAKSLMGNPPGIQLMDVDHDKQLTVSEMMLTLEDSYDYYLDEDDILAMYDALNLDKNNDGIITPSELASIKPSDLETYLDHFIEENPVKRSRMSKQAWLFPEHSQDVVFRQLQERVQRLTKLPAVLIKKSDFQVVNYEKHGHYNAHQDSAPVNTNVPCCDRKRKRQCRICRYMTILFYLNNVEEGGGTAFPLAGNETFDIHTFRQNHQVNLQRHCDSANLVVNPEKGKAVIWYNHQLDPNTGWMGELDDFTWHGGCPVTQGEKWIANFWIKTTNNPKEDLQY